MKPILVTGCGRSGTLYTATLLKKLGVTCYHEKAFFPPVVELPSWSWAEVAWEGAPYTEQLDVDVFHQLREPIVVIRSFVRTGFFEREDKFRRHVYRYLPHIQGLSPVEQAMAYWIEWNAFVVNPKLIYHVEDFGALEWIELLSELGFRVDPELAAVTLPTNINTIGPYSDNEYNWDTLPQGELLEKLRNVAREYEYL